jgi:hypothetical protein
LSSRAAGAEGAFGSGLIVALSLVESFVFAGFLGGIVCEGLALFSASSAAFAASSTDGAAFELALLGAIAGGLFGARTVGAKCWNLLSWASRSNGRMERVCARFNDERQ